ncbi:Phosphotransferase enzyme family protein [Jeotgalicoccus saudimassiliensis]|uniref:Phosphotransferase enzyme family protein n=1 Tax=Jeotgalicoccus saudimassiliensis TaxID=1461582 RepID=A0A078M6D5_9STAP|nr:phosphotransferase [Jeotgalicoccus saudimassiliensis]CEA00947.1 Phosphotransferase enzyme family protein [Jeotgalicoccus saudimassiliensis]
MIEELMSELPLNDIQSITPFNRGWSDDRKFIVTAENSKFLLRVGNIKNKDRFLQHVLLLQQSAEMNIPTHNPAAHGECLSATHYYILLNWIEGNNAGDVLTGFTSSEQYDFGVTAGKILSNIHSFTPVFENPESWSKRYNRKIDRKIEMYNNCELKYQNGELLFDVITKYRQLIKNKTDVQHHGDFHIGNMLIDSNHKLHIIDFDRHDTGEAYEEFNRITWCASVSPEFASGRIDGYFNNDVPEEFWEMLQLYIATNMLSSLPWAIPFGEKEIRTMRRSYAELLNWYDDFELTVPKWYRKYENH